MLSAEVKLQLPGIRQGEALPILDHVAPGPVLGLHLTIGYSMVQLHRLMAGYYHLGLRDSFPILSHSLNFLILNNSLRLDLSCVRLDLLKDCPTLIKNVFCVLSVFTITQVTGFINFIVYFIFMVVKIAMSCQNAYFGTKG